MGPYKILFIVIPMFRYDCHGSNLSPEFAHWKDREGNKMSYWPGGKGRGCACGVNKTCAGGELILLLERQTHCKN